MGSTIQDWARKLVETASDAYDTEYGGSIDGGFADAYVVVRWPIERKSKVIPTGFALSGHHGKMYVTYSSSEGAVICCQGDVQPLPMEQVVSSRFIPGAQIFATTSKEHAIAWLTAAAATR